MSRTLLSAMTIRAADAVPNALKLTCPHIGVGRRVTITGLVSRAELNATTGVVVCWHSASHRWGVQCGQEAIRLRPINLILADSTFDVLRNADLLQHVLLFVLTQLPGGQRDILSAAGVCTSWRAAATAICHRRPDRLLTMPIDQLIQALRDFAPVSEGLVVLSLLRIWQDCGLAQRQVNGNFYNPTLRAYEGGLGALLDAMRKHSASKTVQAFGMYVLSLFCKGRDADCIRVKDELIDLGVIPLVLRAMRTFPFVRASSANSWQQTGTHGGASCMSARGICCQEAGAKVLQGLLRMASDGYVGYLRRAKAAGPVATAALMVAVKAACDSLPNVTGPQCDLLVEGVLALGNMLYATLPQDAPKDDVSSMLLVRVIKSATLTPRRLRVIEECLKALECILFATEHGDEALMSPRLARYAALPPICEALLEPSVDADSRDVCNHARRLVRQLCWGGPHHNMRAFPYDRRPVLDAATKRERQSAASTLLGKPVTLFMLYAD